MALLAGTATPHRAAASEPESVTTAIVATRPHLLDTRLADVLVRVRGGPACSGTPITGTTFIVTAAHCVLDSRGAVTGHLTVRRHGVDFQPRSVLVDPAYHNVPSPLLDAAVLVMDQTIPGPSAALGRHFPTAGQLTVAGFQPLDSDGTLLRGTRSDNRPRPQDATGGVVTIDSAVAGCAHRASDAEVTDDEVRLPCGLIPGASGGGAFAQADGEPVLVGIISTVSLDLTSNGLVPLAALYELLENRAAYTHDVIVAARTTQPIAFRK
jgi:hypothetical protein